MPVAVNKVVNRVSNRKEVSFSFSLSTSSKGTKTSGHSMTPTGTKNSIIFMPGAYDRCLKASHESRFLLLLSPPHVRPYPRISDTSYLVSSTLLPPASPNAPFFSVIKPDTRFSAKESKAKRSKHEGYRSRMSMVSIDHVNSMYLRVCFGLEG